MLHVATPLVALLPTAAVIANTVEPENRNFALKPLLALYICIPKVPNHRILMTKMLLVQHHYPTQVLLNLNMILWHILPSSATHSLAALCSFLELLCKHLLVFGKASKTCMFGNLTSIILLANQIHRAGLLHEHKLTVVISTQTEVIVLLVITVTIVMITIMKIMIITSQS